jgi:hypothetical protein
MRDGYSASAMKVMIVAALIALVDHKARSARNTLITTPSRGRRRYMSQSEKTVPSERETVHCNTSLLVYPFSGNCLCGCMRVYLVILFDIW